MTLKDFIMNKNMFTKKESTFYTCSAVYITFNSLHRAAIAEKATQELKSPVLKISCMNMNT